MAFKIQGSTCAGGGAAIFIVVVALLRFMRSRTARRHRAGDLRRFGNGYYATVRRPGHRSGEDELEQRTYAVPDLGLKRVGHRSRETRTELQHRSLEDPGQSVAEPAHLNVGLIRERGFPHGSIDTLTRHVPVTNPELAEPYRSADEMFRSDEDGHTCIEGMVESMRRYRMLFKTLLKRPKREDEGSAPSPLQEPVRLVQGQVTG